MRLSVSLNDERCFVAALPETGAILAHLVLQDDEHGKRRRLKVSAVHHAGNETIGLEWPSVEARVGDTLQLAIMTEGPGDPPKSQERRQKAAVHLVENEELGAKLLHLCENFEASLAALLAEAVTKEPPEQVEFLRDTFESASDSLEMYLREPVLLAHPRLGR